MPYGYNGKILHVNLTKGTHEVEEPGELFYRTYVGGSSLAAYYLLKYLKPETDPLSPDNILVFAVSVLTGAPISGYSRYTVAAKSPLTGAYGEAEAGGYFGPEMKFAGYDAIVITGKAEKPTYLYIKDGEVEIRSAESLWGLDNWETLEKIREETGEKRVRVASIGPAGEKQVLFAHVQNNMEHHNGRTGMGAVMGSKNLKAVAARGKAKYEYADSDRVKELAREQNERIKNHPTCQALGKFGTPALVAGLNKAGILPTRNFNEGVFEDVDKIAADAYHKEIFHGPSSCFACAVGCKRQIALDDDKYPLDPRWGGPEYEAMGSIGSLVGNASLPALGRANQLCNLLGMDVISAGVTVAFAMECFENGLITEKDTGGRSLKFGDSDALVWLIEEFVKQENIGKLLAQGTKRAAEKIGHGAQKFAMQIKGQEMPVHDGRGKTGVGLGFAVSPTGADHIETPHDPNFMGEAVAKLAPVGLHDPVIPLEMNPQKVRFFYIGQQTWGLNNCYGICNFTSVPAHALTFQALVDSITAITGWESSVYEIMKVTERSNNMMRVFNIREGFSAKDDRVVDRWFEEFKTGPLAGKRMDPGEFEEMKELYYEMCGWDRYGNPTRGKLVELNLEWLIG